MSLLLNKMHIDIVKFFFTGNKSACFMHKSVKLQKAMNTTREIADQERCEREILPGCWNTLIIMQANLSAALLLLRHYFTEHLSCKVMPQQK